MENKGWTPLHQFGEMLRNLMISIPMPVVRCLFIAFFVALIIWVIRLPKHRYTPPNEEIKGWSSNLKIWALIALGLQVVIYIVF